MQRFGLLTAAAVILLSGPALAETSETVTTVGPDGSTTTTTTTYYSDFDANNNGILDDQEFNHYVYRAWDANGDGFISDAEYNRGTVRWYGPTRVKYGPYASYDVNHDMRIDETEFGTVITTTKLYEVYDVDANKQINPAEYSRATFSAYDQDNDGEISQQEWEKAL